METTAGVPPPDGERPHWSSQSHTLIHGPATRDFDGRDPGPARVGQAGRTASGEAWKLRIPPNRHPCEYPPARCRGCRVARASGRSLSHSWPLRPWPLRPWPLRRSRPPQAAFTVARHEHEWKVWRDVKLPDGKVILPGGVTHSTNVVEHPELVADRIVRFAEAVSRQNMVASTDCGLGGRVHPQIAWAKLGTLVKCAELATSQLWGQSRHGPFGIKGRGNRSGTEPSTRAGRVPARVRRPSPGNG
jgi:hypothetical protein